METKFAEVVTTTNPETGEVTMYIVNELWVPVVTGKNRTEAKTKMKEAFGLAMIANSFCATANLQGQDSAIGQ